jgi:4-amino-4-deoxy-L-arabinose transferase-like glycosyltransferase
LETKTKYLFFLLVIGTFLFLFNLGGRDLWEPDETRYAVIAREMVQDGNWILPHLNGKIYSEKPAFFFWLVNLSSFFLGENTEFGNRLPSALAGLAALFITFLFGQKLFSPRTGFLSSLVLATCLLFPQVSRWMAFDSLFTLLFVLTLFCFHRGLEEEDGRRRDYLLAGFFTGLGVLTKGPIAYLPFLIILIFASFQKEIKKFWNRDLLLGFLVSLAVICFWLIPACWMGGEEYTQKILFGRTLRRFAGVGKYFHPQSFFFYFIRFPVESFPWTFFIPITIIFAMGKRKGKGRQLLFLSVWFILIFLFFTISKAKKDTYILPLYPAAALMVGWGWDSIISSKEKEKGMIISLILLVFLFCIGFVLLLTGLPQKLYPHFISYMVLGASILLYLSIGSAFSLFLFLKQRKFAAAIVLVITFVLLHLHLSYVLPTKLNPQRSMKTFSETILKRMGEGDDIKTFCFQSKGLIYYTKKPYIEEIVSEDRLFEVLHSSQRVFIVFLAEFFDKLKRDSKIAMDPIEKVRVGHWNYVLVSNR